jgi:hypothetical protein
VLIRPPPGGRGKELVADAAHLVRRVVHVVVGDPADTVDELEQVCPVVAASLGHDVVHAASKWRRGLRLAFQRIAPGAALLI